MKTRPWIWIMLGYAAFVAGISTMVVIAVKNRPAEVPVAKSR